MPRRETTVKKAWFRSNGLLALPVSWEAWAITVGLALFCIQVFIAVDRHSHSVSDTFYGVFPYFGVTFLFHQWLGGRRGAA